MDSPPVFRYHPDPVGTGSAVLSTAPCDVCARPAGHRYVGPIVGREVDVLCLSCIADGTASEALTDPGGSAAEFTDARQGAPPQVSPAVLEEISRRTPGFSGWQQERWLYHCDDGAAFLGVVGWAEVQGLPDAVTSLVTDLTDLGLDAEDASEQVRSLTRDGDVSGYLFRCLHCGIHVAYSDAS